MMMNPIVEIQQGKLLGTVSEDLDGNTFYSFRGIPYAQPPIGRLRFKAPLPPSPWKGIFQATKNGNCCCSSDVFHKRLIGSEDCLNLNIYTPKLPPTETLLPVMVFVHGGGFLCGSNNSEMYGPEFLMTGNIVLVTLNYRLGILGHLSLHDPSLGVPGNACFKDMVMGLRWVQNNITQFGGDPKNVTIFGESVGGASVHLLMLSPMTHGLFHKVIAQSACATNTMSRGRKIDEKIYKAYDFEGKSEKEFLEHLQSLPVDVLVRKQSKIDYVIDPATPNYYGLVIERSEKEQNEVPFMDEDPVDVILSGKFPKVPFMIGFANLEGLTINTYKPHRSEHMLTNFESNIPYFLGYETGSKASKVLGEKIKKFYFGNEEPKNNRDKFYEMVTDHSFLYGIYSSVRMHVMHNHPVYFYRMSITTSLKFLQALMKIDKDKGAAHGDDIAYLFKTMFTPQLSTDSEEYKAIKNFVRLWTNFAYYGNPTPEGFPVTWKMATDKQIGFLNIDKTLKFYDKFEKDSIRFWNQIYAESPKGQKYAKFYAKF